MGTSNYIQFIDLHTYYIGTCLYYRTYVLQYVPRRASSHFHPKIPQKDTIEKKKKPALARHQQLRMLRPSRQASLSHLSRGNCPIV